MRNSSYRVINMPWGNARQHEEDFFKSSPLWLQVPDVNNTFFILISKKELPFHKMDILDLIFKCEEKITAWAHLC